nr:nitroreductase/quinone reductase family protein [Nocardia iowensis]
MGEPTGKRRQRIRHHPRILTRLCSAQAPAGRTEGHLTSEPPGPVRPGAASGWLLNIRAHPHVRIRLPDATFDGVAREITQPTERMIARTILCETVTRPITANAPCICADA